MIRHVNGKSVYVAVISARRPANVPAMIERVGHASWFVETGGAHAYEAQGAQAYDVGGLIAARNTALEAARSCGADLCLQLSDDLKKLERAVWSIDRNKYVAEPLTIDAAISLMIDVRKHHPAKLVGVAPTANPFYYGGNPFRPRGFVVGDMMLIDAMSTPRFSTEIDLKEDYDFTMQHIEAYKLAARRDDVLATFAHRSNAGGAVSYRTAEKEQHAIAFLKQRWPGVFRDNPKRPNEILMRLR